MVSEYCAAVGNIQLLNNTIVGNLAPSYIGGAAAVLSPATNNAIVLANNIVAFNSSGITLYPGSATPTLRNNCVTNPANYNGLSAGVGDINVDPQLVNPSAGDFHLLASSPCIDSGFTSAAAAADFDGMARPLDGNNDGLAAFDMGAYEFVHPAADTDHDGVTDRAEIIAGTNPT